MSESLVSMFVDNCAIEYSDDWPVTILQVCGDEMPVLVRVRQMAITVHNTIERVNASERIIGQLDKAAVVRDTIVATADYSGVGGSSGFLTPEPNCD